MRHPDSVLVGLRLCLAVAVSVAWRLALVGGIVLALALFAVTYSRGA